MPYSQQISSKTPGLFLILLDQSGSMQDPYGSCTKARTAAEVVNYMIYELQETCMDGGEIKPRLSLGVIGYGDSARPLFACKIDKVPEKVIGQQKYSRGQVTCAGQEFQSDFTMPIWVKEKANGGTPMGDAFNRAREVAEMWLKTAPASFPPVIINVTDGEPDNMDAARSAARRLVNEIATSDGNALLFNVHIIDDRNAGEILMPASSASLAGMQNETRGFAEFLYDISSVLPDSLLSDAAKAGLSPQPGSRGFIFNASPTTLFKMMKFGTTTIGSKRR